MPTKQAANKGEVISEFEADLFPDRLVPSELGEIPAGWEVKTLSDLVHLNPRETMKRGTLAPYLDMAALTCVMRGCRGWCRANCG